MSLFDLKLVDYDVLPNVAVLLVPLSGTDISHKCLEMSALHSSKSTYTVETFKEYTMSDRAPISDASI